MSSHYSPQGWDNVHTVNSNGSGWQVAAANASRSQDVQ